jgi:replicative DNA helicase
VIDKVGEMFDENKDPAEIIGFFRNAADRVQSFDVEYVDESLKDSNIALRRYREQVKKLSVKGSFLDSPWPRMNKIINFCRPGELIVCAARLGLGKTWVISRWAEHLAGQGIETFFMSKEMPTQQISDRMTALRYRLDWPRFRSLQLDVFDQIRWKIKRYKTRNQPYPLLVSGEETFEGTGLQQLYSKILRVKPRAVFVDGAYLFNVPGLSKNANEVEKLTAISRGLKRIAKVTQTTVFAVIQMNRNAENKKGVALGGVTTAYGSDSWAQDADTFFEIAGERGADERVVKVHKSRETNIGDYFINFKLSPHPDFSEKSRLSSGSALGQVPFKTIV